MAHLAAGIAPAAVLHLAYLVVIGVVTPEAGAGLEVRLEGIGGDVAVNVQVAKIVLVPQFRPGPVGAAAEGGVREHPAVGRHIEHGPVVAAHAVGVGHHAALPLGGDAGAAAQGDKGQCLHAAVAPAGPQAGIRDLRLDEIVGHEAVFHLGSDIVIEAAGLFHRVGDALGQLGAQGLYIGGEHDVGRVLTGIEVRLDGVGLDPGGIHIGGHVGVGILHPEGMVFGHGLLPADGAGVGVLIGNVEGLAVAVMDLNVALLDAAGGQGDVYPVGLAGDKKIILHLDGVAQADAGAHAALFLHDAHGAVQPSGAVQLLVADLLGVHRLLGQAGGDLRLLAQGAEEGAHQMLLSLHKDPGDPAVVHVVLQLLHGEIGDLFPDTGQAGLFGKGELAGQAHHDLPLGHQVFPHTPGQAVLRQHLVHHADGMVKIAGLLQVLHLFGQADAGLTQKMILIHKAPPVLWKNCFQTDCMPKGRGLSRLPPAWYTCRRGTEAVFYEQADHPLLYRKRRLPADAPPD